MSWFKCLVVVLILKASGACGQPRFGYVCYEDVKVTIPQYADGLKALEQRNNQLSDSMAIAVRKFERLIGEEHNLGPDVDSIKMKNLQDKLDGLQEEFWTIQEHAKSEITKMKIEIDRNLRQDIERYLKQFAADNNLIVAPDIKLLYCNNCFDFTSDFVNYLIAKNR